MVKEPDDTPQRLLDLEEVCKAYHVLPQFRTDFKLFVAEGKVSRDFISYLEADTHAQDAAVMVFAYQSKPLQEYMQYLRTSISLRERLLEKVSALRTFR